MRDDKDAQRRQLSGVAFMCVGVLAFTFQDLIIKDISRTYPAHEIVFIRSFLALPFTLLIAWFETGLHRLDTPRVGAHMLRGTVFFLAYTLYYLGIAALPLAMAVAISFAAPLFITALAGPLLGEKVGKIRWLAVVLGFIGVLVVMKDGLGMLEWAVLLPALSALLLCARPVARPSYRRHRIGIDHVGLCECHVLHSVGPCRTGHRRRRVRAMEPSEPRIPARAWVWPTQHDLLLILGCGVAATIGIYCLGQGYRMAEANLAAIFEYTALPWAILWGFLFFSQLPGLSTLAGVGLVIFAGIVIAIRERPRRTALREQRDVSSPRALFRAG